MDEAAEAIEKEGIIVPEPELATPGMTVLEIAQETIEPPNEEGQENGCKITQSHLLKGPSINYVVSLGEGGPGGPGGQKSSNLLLNRRQRQSGRRLPCLRPRSQ